MFGIEIPLGNEVTIPQALFISLFSIMVVFFVLLIISYLIDFVAIILHKKKK